jgi:hypothetical protein
VNNVFRVNSTLMPVLMGAGSSLSDKREQERLQITQTWGVWVWLIAEFVPDGELSHREERM